MNKLIGNTPMIKINYLYKNKKKSLFAKLESYNLTGSIKDRIAYYIINKAKTLNELKDNQPIIEATSGNTGISFASLGAYYKHPVYIFMPDWCSCERVNLMKLYGANVTLVSKEDGGFKKCIAMADKLARDTDGFRPNQFNNNDNIEAHYLTTGVEIINNLKDISGFVSGIGTGGTLMGIGKRLKEYNPDIKVVALEPKTMAILSGGELSSHKIEGIGDDFIPEIVNRDIIDDIYQIDDNDAIKMSQMLGINLGLGVGISSGANFLAGVILNDKIDGNVVTVFPDDNKKYLTTDLVDLEISGQDFISNDIKLLDYEII